MEDYQHLKDSYSRYLKRRKDKKNSKPFLALNLIEKNAVRALICLAVAFLLEITVFQYNHYGTLFADDPIDDFEWNGGLTNVSDDSEHPVYMARDYNSGETDNAKITLKLADLNMRVASVHIKPVFVTSEKTGEQAKTMSCYVKYTDEESTNRNTQSRVIVKGLKYTEYIPINAIGNVSELTVVFNEPHGAFSNIEINKTIPLTPVALRIFLVAGIIFVIGTLRRYNVFALRFDASSKRQNAVFAAVLAVFSAYCCFLATAGYIPDINKVVSLGSDGYRWNDQYNYLADALARGRLDIDVGVGAGKLINSKRPYDMNYKIENKIEYPHDTAFYNGKFYSYFGIVPCILLYLPFNLITNGGHLPNWIPAFIFCSFALIFLSLSLRELVKRFFPNIAYTTFLLATFALSFCSFAPFVSSSPRQYEIAVLSGLAFTALGMFLLFKFAFGEHKRLVTLIFSCLSFALAVGCRATMVFWSVLVPVFVWNLVKEKSTRLKTIIAVATPYIVIAVPLMWYNYVRFGSVTEFGVKYAMTEFNFQIHTAKMSPVEFLYICIAGGVEGYYFKMPIVSDIFPFVRSASVSTATEGLLTAWDSGVFGILTVPIIWFFIKMRSASAIIREKDARLIRAFIAGMCAFVIISFVSPAVGGIIIRYSVDFMWFAVLSSLVVICALLYKHADTVMAGVIEKLSGAAMFASGLLGLCSTFVGNSGFIINSSPQVYYYLKRAMTFFAGE